MPKQNPPSYHALCQQAYPYLSGAIDGIPAALRGEVESALFPFQWDSLSPARRDLVLYQHDCQHDPALANFQQLCFDVVWAEETREQYRAMRTPLPSEVVARDKLVKEQEKLIRKLEGDIQREWNNRPLIHWSRDFDDDGRRIKEPLKQTLNGARLVIGSAAAREALLKHEIDEYRKGRPKVGRGEAAAKFASDARFDLGVSAIGNRIRKWYGDEEWPKKSVGGRPRKTVHRRK